MRRPILRNLISAISVGAISLGVSSGSTAAQSATPIQWELQGNVQQLASASLFEAADVTHFPTALAAASLSSKLIRFYLVHGQPIPRHPGQYEYPFRVVKSKSVGTIRATEIAINSKINEELYAVDVTAARVNRTSGLRTRKSSFFRVLQITCNSGDISYYGNAHAYWQSGDLVVASDQDGLDVCYHGDHFYNLSQYVSGGPQCDWTVTQNSGEYSGIHNNDTSAVEAYYGNDYSCSGGPNNCEIDYQPIEYDQYLNNYAGYNDNTHIVSLGSVNCSTVYSVQYLNA